MTDEYYLVSISRGDQVELIPVVCKTVLYTDNGGLRFVKENDFTALLLSPRTDYHVMELTVEQYDVTVSKLESQESEPEEEAESGTFQERLTRQSLNWQEI